MEKPSVRDSQACEIVERLLEPSPLQRTILPGAMIRSCLGACVVRCCTRAIGQKSLPKKGKVVQGYDLVVESGISGAMTQEATSLQRVPGQTRSPLSLSPRQVPKAAVTESTTAQDETQKGLLYPQTVMNDDPTTEIKLHEALDDPTSAVPDANIATPNTSISPIGDEVLGSNEAAVKSNHVNLNDRSDSEAETVVLDGKPDTPSDTTGKAIKNENPSDSEGSHSPKTNGAHRVAQMDKTSDDRSDRPSLKRKRTSASNLSSTTSSPAPQTHSSHGSDLDLDQTRPTSTLDESLGQKQTTSRKRKVPPGTEDHDRKKRGKSDPSAVMVHRKERREVSNSMHEKATRHRSDSPPSRQSKRASSAQASNILEPSKRRKAPPPPLAERPRQPSEDSHGDSDESSSTHSHPHLQKVASISHSVMSPAKLPHKKNRDRNGLTLLARACGNDLTDARKRLEERPDDIDVPDNAGNTPLQIASLKGLADIVQLLLEAGCDITCKNIDMDTPLIDAVENGHLEVVRLLLNAGLDPRQSNAKGEELTELADPDHDSYDDIRAALLAARLNEAMRRPSGDHSALDRDNDLSSLGHSAASPTNGQAGRSPPPSGPGARRRTARSQPTQDALLWVNPTPARLREACMKNDPQMVDHILKMRPEVGTDAVIVAARAGHEVVLEILFAVGKPDHDPDPVESEDFKSGRNTPMLAAIGRGFIPIIKLLISQRGFNPTRRVFRGLTYWELSKERQGSNWEEEYTVLKEAYDDYRLHGGRRSNHSSPRKIRVKKLEAGQTTSNRSAASSSVNKRQLSSSSAKIASEFEIKREHSHKAPSNKHLSIPEELKDSAVVSDRDSESTNQTEPRPKAARSISDASHALSKSSDPAKPKRKLLSRNEDAKRRAHLGRKPSLHEQKRRQSGDSSTLEQGREKRKMSAPSISMPKVRQNSSTSSKVEPGKKRPRRSPSPQQRSPRDESSPDSFKNKKKRRVDSDGNAIVQEPMPGAAHVRTGPAMVANMIASPEPVTSPSEPQRRAPVANMGTSSVSPVTKSPTDPTSQSEPHSPMTGIEQTIQEGAKQGLPQEHPAKPPPIPLSPDGDQSQVDADSEVPKRRLAEQEQAQNALDEAAHAAQVAREEEEARLERQRQAEEAERQARREQEEEEARITKQRREEELARRRVEQDRHRREEQERRRAEQEERERQRRIRQQEEEEQQRLEALPVSLRRAAVLSPEKARQSREIKKWLPLRTVTTRQLDPGCDDNVADERWTPNVQVAPILAIKDLDLSQYTAWTRLGVTAAQRQSLWRQLRNMVSQAAINPLTFTQHDALRLDAENAPKFCELKSVFWIKLVDFLDIVPRHPHLAGLTLSTRPMVLHEHPWGPGKGPGDHGHHEGGMDGPADLHASTNGAAVNGGGMMVNGFR
ncbi:MAG: hypothetical protein L6R37_006598 [Teloschistes peruensis]|nr:MAG: hypothetical protein L6R37_006598 [Teloschistes peruensis]